MKMNAKTGARAKILAYVLRNGLSTINEIMAGVEEPERNRADDNVRAAVNDGLMRMRRDDVTRLPGYEITPEGREWLKAKGKPEATTQAAGKAKAGISVVEPEPKTAKAPKPKAAAVAVQAAVQAPAKAAGAVDVTEQLRESLAGERVLSQAVMEICCAIGADPKTTITSELPGLVKDYAENRIGKETAALLGVLADIRKAIGDDTGRIMQGELAAHIAKERNSLLSDQRDFVAHFYAISPITEELLDRYGTAISSTRAVQIMSQLIDAQHAHLTDLDMQLNVQSMHIETLTNKLEIAARLSAQQEQQIAELRARVEAQILAGHESASSANRLLTEVHQVLSTGWPVGVEAPTGRTTVQLAQAMAKAFGELYVEHMAGHNLTPDAYLVTRNDDRGVTRHKSPDAAQRKAKSVVRAGAKLATVYAATRVAKATRGPVIETR